MADCPYLSGGPGPDAWRPAGRRAGRARGAGPAPKTEAPRRAGRLGRAVGRKTRRAARVGPLRRRPGSRARGAPSDQACSAWRSGSRPLVLASHPGPDLRRRPGRRQHRKGTKRKKRTDTVKEGKRVCPAGHSQGPRTRGRDTRGVASPLPHAPSRSSANLTSTLVRAPTVYARRASNDPQSSTSLRRSILSVG